MVICKPMGCQKVSFNVGQCREQPNFKCDKYPANCCVFFYGSEVVSVFNFVVGTCALCG